MIISQVRTNPVFDLLRINPMKKTFTPTRSFFSPLLRLAWLALAFLPLPQGLHPLQAQCDTEVSGVFTYCNSFHMGNPVTGYFVAFRVKDLTGDTLNVVDLNSVVPMNQGKRVDNISTQEPANYTVQPLRISGVGADTLEFWYFGPYPNGSTFDIALIDPNNVCDTVFVASGTYDCADNTGVSDPGACDNDVPLYFLDFSFTEFTYGGGFGGNENFDEIFLIMPRSRENFCCDLQPANQRCFEFIVRLDDQDIGLSIDDVGSGSTAGEFYADTLNMFACTGTSSNTWPFTVAGGQSSDLPLCLGFEGEEFVVLSCKSGANVTGASIDAISNIFSPPEATIEPCNVSLQVFNVDSAMWSSPDDPNLINLISCTGDSVICMFFYDTATFGQVTDCAGDTFTYIVAGNPVGNACFGGDTTLYDTTYVVVYPVFTVDIDTSCSGDSLVLSALVTSPATGCLYAFDWSNGDTTQTITVPFSNTEYFVTVTRGDLPMTAGMCVLAVDSIVAAGGITVDCSQVTDTVYFCVSSPPDPDPSLVLLGGCGGNPLVYAHDYSNGGSGCQQDTLIITRYYIVDFDGDTINTTTDRDTCPQFLKFVDDTAPSITCPPGITVQCAALVPAPNTGSVTASDACGGIPVITHVSDVTVNQTCTNQYTLQRTYRATDACGNSSTCIQVISVFDNTAPGITCPANVTVQCASQVPAPSPASVTATDNCSGTPSVTHVSDVTVNQTCINRYMLNRTYRATDACGNSATCVQVITVFDNTAPSITCPVNITVQCAAQVPAPNPPGVTTSDNCNGTPVVTHVSDVTVNQICTNQFTLNRTYRSTDECGNSATCVQVITVFDNTLPTITCPGNVTVQCASLVPAPNTATVTASDNCGGVPAVTFVSDVTINQTCVNRYTLNRTYRATDACGNSASCVQVITVFDNTPPTVTCPSNVTVQCASQVPGPLPGIVTAVDNCGGAPVVTFVSDVTVNQTCANRFDVNRTYRATDACGNSATCTQVISVFDNTPPTITCPSNVTVQCASQVPTPNPGTITANDNCSGTPTVTHVGDVTVSQVCVNQFVLNRTYRATDICGNSATCVQVITVFDNTVPSITCPANVTVQCASQVPAPSPASVTASDNCNGVPLVTHVGDVTINQSCVNRYTLNRTYRATDECGNSSTCIQVITVFDNTVPSITCPANVTVQCASLVPAPNPATVTASDNCSGVPVITHVSDVTVNQSCINRYTLNRTYRATDECGNSATCLQVITVLDNTLPGITCPADITVQCASLVPAPNPGTVTASDNCGGVPVITHVGDVTVNQTCVNRYTLNRTYRATDACGNSSTCVQVITIFDNTPPTLTCPSNVTVQCASQIPAPQPGIVTSLDNCGGVPVVIHVSDVTVNQTCANRFDVNRTYRATDACGNSATCVQIISVFDNTAPTITCPANITVQCASLVPAPNPGGITANDNCSGTPTVTHVSDVTINQTCVNRYTLNRTYRATDACGNSTTCVQTITVLDNTVPTITCPANVTVQCASLVPAPNTGSVTASDNCSGVPVVTHVSDVTVNQTCINRYMVNRTYRATDECGNSTTCIQLITVFDNTVPSITCPPNVTVQCASLVPAPNTGSVTASDNCNGVPVVTHVSDVTVNQTCINRYMVNRTYRATDECGNSATCIQVITVFDNTVPSITCPPNVTVQCASLVPAPNTGSVTASDNCNGVPVVTHVSDVTVNQTCINRYMVNRTYRATDECGNSATCIQVITVFDNTVPSITCPANVTVQCASLVPAPNTGSVTASDNCNGVPVVTHVSDVTVNQTCINRYMVNRTYRATDECGNSATCIQVITVFDNTVPSITCPANVTVQCATLVPAPNTGSVTASDNCNGIPVITHVSDVTVNQTCINRYMINRTYRATDECGNSATCIQVITVFDNTVPGITCPANVTVQCASQVPAPAPGSVTSNDNCGGTPSVTHVSDVTVNQSCVNRYTLNRTYQAIDACGNSATCIQVITVFDNTVPTITCPPAITVQCASQVPTPNPGSVTSNDNCGGSPVVTHVNDVTVNQTCTNRYTLNRTYRATDACGNSSTCLQVITVFDNTIPTITCPPNVTIGIQDNTLPANTGNPTTADNCGGQPAVTFADMTVAGMCVFQYTINRTWKATDACGNSSTCLQTVFVNGGCIVDLSLVKNLDPNQGPFSGGDIVNFTITISNDGEQSISSVSVIDYIPVGFSLNDPDWTPGTEGSTGQSASITLSIANGGLDANGLNPGETVSVQITLLIDPDIPGGVYVNVAEITQVININGDDVTADDIDSTPDDIDTNDPADEDDHDPAEICIAPQPVIIGDPYVCPGELVPYSVENYNPANTYVWTLSGGGIIVQNNGGDILVQWSNNPGGPFQITVQEIASPSCQATAFLVVFIQGLEPIACNDNVQISLGPDGIAVVTPEMILEGENEANNNYIVIITDQYGNVIPNATLNCSHVGQILMVSVQNICNNQSCWGTITVEDKIPPQISCTCPPGNTDPACEVNCLQVDQLVDGNIPPGLQPTVTDNCPNVVVSILQTDLHDEGCGGGYIIVTWKATDQSGNSATCTQQFNIIPLTLDSLIFPANYIGPCGTSIDPAVTGWPQVDGLNLTDEGGLCNIFAGYWDKQLADCGGGGKISRTWTVLDWCTLELVEGIQIIKLTDTEGPVITCPADMQIGTDFWYCYASFSVPKPEAYDVCSEIESYVLHASAGTVVSFGNNYVINGLPIGTHIITWIVTDECGNSSTCSFKVTVADDVVPVANCDHHTIVSLTNDGPKGLTLVPAEVFDDGSYDNCGPVTFRARRMDSCIDFDWTTEGACIDDIPGGVPPVNSRDRGTVHRPCVPFSCCDVGAGPVMVELEVTDASGNKNYCMVEAQVQDKISPYVECPPDIVVSCDFWFNVQEGLYTDAEGNNNGNLDEDPLSRVFGNMYDAFRYDEGIRGDIVIDDPGNSDYFQPHFWGIDGWADDNCAVHLQVRVRVIDDCSGGDLPANAPQGAVKLIERRFSAIDDQGNVGTCSHPQQIWVVDFDPFYITDNSCNNANPNDGVIWPCDVVLTTCPDDISGTGQPIVFDDACSLIGVTYEDTRFDFVEGACFKILRDWAVIDWCQYNPQTGEGLWHYTQVIKVHDQDGPVFVDCPAGTETLCLKDPGVSLPDNNQVFLGEQDPQSTACSVHLNLHKTVAETCSDVVQYDVKLYLFNGPDYVQVQPTTSAVVDSTNHADLSFDTRQSPIQAIRKNGIPYNSPACGNYHKILWSVQDGCGNWSHCEYLLRLEDCKQPSPVCINGLSTVVMPVGGQVTIWAKDFNASSVDDCTPSDELLYSFSGDAYQPSYTYTCDNVPAFGVELSQQIWVADGGVDHNCNGQIEWNERNKDYCTTTIVINDNNDVCDSSSGSILAGEILTDQAQSVAQVQVSLLAPGHYFPTYTTLTDGKYKFTHVPEGPDYTIQPERDDNPKNGVSTLDLVKIQKHLLGIEAFTSPYQYIAADANNNQQLSAIDLIEIRKLILGIYTTFPNNHSWRFVEKGYPMETDHPWPFGEQIAIPGFSAGSLMNNDFVAVKIGDVNHTAQANAQSIDPRNGNRVLTLRTKEQEVKEGETVRMVIPLSEKLSGFQWTLETSDLVFVKASSDAFDLGDDNVAVLADGIVTMSWNGEMHAGENGSGAALVLEWKATRSGRLSEMIRMTSRVTDREAYTLAEEILDPRLVFEKADGGLSFALYQNKPNPWNGETAIGFDLPADAPAVLTVFDMTGKEILRIEGNYQAGYNTIVLSEKALPVPGILYYRLESGVYTASKKMVLLR